MKSIEQYLSANSSNCDIIIMMPSCNIPISEREIIVQINDYDKPHLNEISLSVDEWKMVLEKSRQYNEPLHCDDCGIVTDNPWHASEGHNRHIHRCDTCHAKATEEIALLIKHRNILTDFIIDKSVAYIDLHYKEPELPEDAVGVMKKVLEDNEYHQVLLSVYPELFNKDSENE